MQMDQPESLVAGSALASQISSPLLCSICEITTIAISDRTNESEAGAGAADVAKIMGQRCMPSGAFRWSGTVELAANCSHCWIVREKTSAGVARDVSHLPTGFPPIGSDAKLL